MSYKLTNVSGGLIVCDLAVEGKTLRLNNRQVKTIKSAEITKHIENMINNGLMLCESVEEKTKKNSVSNSKKEKEE